MFYDFHIHSCLSPCCDDDMTPNNIVNMALIKKLDMIAICDHNSTKQQRAIHDVAALHGLRILYGVEIQTIEEVHVCCYFETLDAIESFQLWIDEKMQPIKNNETYFGHQFIMDETDQLIACEEYLLLSSLQTSLDELCNEVHHANGKVVLAHVLDRVNSITHQLGFIPQTCAFDGIEVKHLDQKQQVLSQAPWITDTTWFINSDAHRLIDINEPCHALSTEEYQHFWRVKG